MALRRNPNLKKANEEVPITGEQILEFKKCAADPVYFIDTYCRVQHPTKGAVRLRLYEYQKDMIRAFHEQRYVIVLSARQTGKSTVSAAFLLWYSMFHLDKTILIASNKNDNAMEMIYRIQYMYENVPMWLKPGVTDDGWNKHSLSFENNSRIISTATSETAGRGLSISLLFLDEFAFVDPGIQEQFWVSMAPTLATGGSCIMSSTPNGDTNLFAQLWRGAQVELAAKGLEGNGFHPVEVAWNAPPGRDEKFKQAEIAKMGQQKWLQEYECVRGDTTITVKDVRTGLVVEVTIEELYNML